MPHALIQFMHALYERWRFATAEEFLILGVAIVAVGWLIARMEPDTISA